MKERTPEPQANPINDPIGQGGFRKKKKEQRCYLQSILELAEAKLPVKGGGIKPAGELISRDLIENLGMDPRDACNRLRYCAGYRCGKKGKSGDPPHDPSKWSGPRLFTIIRSRKETEKGRPVQKHTLTDLGRRKLREMRLKHG